MMFQGATSLSLDAKGRMAVPARHRDALAALADGRLVMTALDAAGRLLITPELRTVASLEKQVWLVGMGSHFEVWSDAGWKRQHEAAFEAISSTEPPPGFEDFSL